MINILLWWVWGTHSLFANVSHQTRLDTRSIARRPIKVRIRGGEGRERAGARALLVYVAHQLTEWNVSLKSRSLSKGVNNAARPPGGSPAETGALRSQICHCSFWEPRSEPKSRTGSGLQFSRTLGFHSTVIFRAVFLWSFVTTRLRLRRSLSNNFRFRPEFCFSAEVFSSFSNVLIIFKTVLLATSNNSAVFVTRAPANRAPTIWPF